MHNIGEIGSSLTGQKSETETSLYYYRARYYDSTPGRFLSEDPVRFAAGVNFYAYVADGPTNTPDPTGNGGGIICPRYLPYCRNESPKCDKDKNCNISIDCGPTPRTHGYSHCTVTIQNGSDYTAFDGAPSGWVLFSRLVVKNGKGAAPGPNSFGHAAVPCDCAQKEADAINSSSMLYSFPIQNSNTAAALLAASCGVNPKWPSGAVGAHMPPLNPFGF